MKWRTITVGALVVIAGIYWIWSGNQNRNIVSRRILDEHMSFKLGGVTVKFYDSSQVHVFDSSLLSEVWLISADDDHDQIVEYCEKRPFWTPSPGTDVTKDHPLNHSIYLGRRFAPCELVIERAGVSGEDSIFITFDGRYLMVERFVAWY